MANRLSELKIAAMEEDWITSPVQPIRRKFARKHKVAESTVQYYYQRREWKKKREMYFAGLAKRVAELEKQLKVGTKGDKKGWVDRETATAAVEADVEVIGRETAAVIAQDRSATLQGIDWLKKALLQLLQNITTRNTYPVIATATTPREIVMRMQEYIGQIPPAERIRLVPQLARAVTEVIKLEEVMEGRVTERMEHVVGVPVEVDLTPEEEAAWERIRRKIEEARRVQGVLSGS